MTVQVGIEWDLLEQEFPAIPCENIAHGGSSIHPAGGEATHYAQLKCPRCKAAGPLEAICEAAVKILFTDMPIACGHCPRFSPARLYVQTLEPIKK